MKAFTQGRYNRNNEQQHRSISASFRPYEEPPSSPVVLAPSEFMIDFGDGNIVDLSNLVSPKSRMKPPPPSSLPPPAPRPPPARKQKSRARLYPTEDMVAPLPDLRTEDLLAKCSVRRGKPTPVREMERMGSWRRSKTGDSTFYPASRDQRYEQLPPGAYDFNPSSDMPDVPPTSRRDSYSVCSNNSNGNSYDGGYPSSNNKHSSNNGYGYQNDYESHSYKITSQPPPPPPPEYDHLQVEICPGHYAALRGSEETWGAIQRGFCSNVNCFNCGLALVCIADAEYVLCPECRVVSPVLTEEEPLMMDCKIPARNAYGQPPAFRGGVGLGLRARQAQSLGVASSSSSYGGY